MIKFFSQNSSFKIEKPNFYRLWMNTLIKHNGYKTGYLNIIFCSDNELLEINRTYLRHDYCTDVITFDHSKLYNDHKISGDLFISIDTVRYNANLYHVSFQEELIRVIAHGVLHLLGYNDKAKREKEIMYLKEEEAILLLNNLK